MYIPPFFHAPTLLFRNSQPNASVMQRLYPFAFLSILLVTACEPAKLTDPQAIVERAIEAHGGDLIENATVTFTYRDRDYILKRDNGMFHYSRTYTDTTGNVYEVLSNDSLYRAENGSIIELDEERYLALESSMNSITYFFMLPYRLNDPAVIKEYVGETEIEGEPYYEVLVAFEQEGGGRDFEDRFLYWFHQDTFTMDYLAYEFHVDDGGIRFRKADNIRTIDGIRFQDYLNYNSSLTGTDLENFDEYFSKGAFELLSEIRKEDIQVMLR